MNSFSDSSEKKHKYEWGDTVIIKKSTPDNLHPGEIGSICSIIKLGKENIWKKNDIGSEWAYTVEFGDGSSIDLSECYLDPYP